MTDEQKPGKVRTEAVKAILSAVHIVGKHTHE